jgi:hypothetical protein
MERTPLPDRKKPVHEGEKYLELLGIGQFADAPIPDTGLKLRDFLEVCVHARHPLEGLALTNRDDPEFEQGRQTIVSIIAHYTNLPEIIQGT